MEDEPFAPSEKEASRPLSSVERIAALSPEEIKQRQKEFEQQLIPCEERCKKYAHLLCRDSPLSWEDLFQEATVRAWRSFHYFNGEQPFVYWFLRIIRNTFFDYLRVYARKGAFDSLETLQVTFPNLESIIDQTLGGVITPEDAQLEWEMALEQICQFLRPPFREAFLLYMKESLQGLSYEEFSEKYGMNLGTLRSRLNRARHALREALQKDEYFASIISAAQRRGKIRTRPQRRKTEPANESAKS